MSPDFLHRLDQDLSLAINSLNGAFSDPLMQMFSHTKVWIPFYLIVTVFLFYRLGWKKALVVALSIGATIALCDQTSNLLKYAVGRLRPCYNFDMIDGGLHLLERRGSFFGFFSAHSANAFGFAACSLTGFRSDSSRNYKFYGILAFVWAALVGISRVFVGKHYLGDVIVGCIIGLSYGYIMGKLARLAISKFLS